MTAVAKAWDGAIVRVWLERRILAARADQVAAEKGGYREQDDCDKATAEEMVCILLLKDEAAASLQSDLALALKGLLDRDDYVWRGVYDDTRFERHVRTYIRKVLKMTKANAGFDNILRYQ